MNSFITQQNLTITRLTLKIIFPLTIILSTMLLIHEIRLLPINKRIYDRLIFTLVLLSLLHTSVPTYYIYSNYKDLQNPNAYRLSLITTSWPAFMSMFVFRLSNMEMLRLLYVLTPFFTPSRITKIQIVESIFGIILSGGIFIYPFTELNQLSFLSKYFDIIFVYLLYCNLSCYWQCIYLSMKMHKFSKTCQKLKQETISIWPTILYLIFFMLFTMASFLLGVIGLVIGYERRNSPFAAELGADFVLLSMVLLPFQIYVYKQIFMCIKKMRFQAEMKRKSAERLPSVLIKLPNFSFDVKKPTFSFDVKKPTLTFNLNQILRRVFKMISIACNSILLQQLQTTSKIVYPILTAIGFTSLFTHLYEYRTHQRLYQTLILILKFFALELAMLSTVTAYYPELWISHYRIMSMLNSIGVFCYPILFMVTDLEMLKLLYVLTSFSVGFIVKVQIFELLLGIGLGGGVLCFPFTDLSANHICSKWYDLITILIGYASLVVVCQCIYISIKMFQYVTSAHASKERTVYIWYAIPTILIFFIVCVVGDVMAVVGFQIRTYKSECSIAGDIGIILVNGSTCLSTLLIFIYGFIFKFIKNMKFGEEHVVRHSKKASRNVAMTK